MAKKTSIEMKQRYADVTSLKRPEYYRKNKIEGNDQSLSKSIEKFDVASLLIVNTFPGREGVVINGVQVLDECQKRKITKVLVYQVYYNLADEKALHATLNTLKTELSKEMLVELLASEYFDFFPELDDASVQGYELEPVLSKMIDGKREIQKHFRAMTLRYSDETASQIKQAEILSGYKTINQLIAFLVKDYVERSSHA